MLFKRTGHANFRRTECCTSLGFFLPVTIGAGNCYLIPAGSFTIRREGPKHAFVKAFFTPEAARIKKTEVSEMETTRIAISDLRISRIGLGTWSIGGWMWGGTQEREAIA